MVIRRTIAAADATNANGVRTPTSDVERAPVPQIGQSRKYFGILLCIEPHEVLMVTLDKKGRSRCPSVLPEPSWKVFLSLALEAHRREAISLAKLKELFATVLEKPRDEIDLAEFGVVIDELPTPVRIPK